MFNYSNKAGLPQLESKREEINQKILECSRGSKFHLQQEKKDQRTQERIQTILDKRNQLSQSDLAHCLNLADKLVGELESSRDLSRFIVHVDMDAFYAACEILDAPQLRNVPMAVGDSAMLCTANYEARKFGVRSAMPGFIARELCPNLKIIKPNFVKYKQKSLQVQAVFAVYDAQFDMMSLDEAYLDLTDFMQREQQVNQNVSKESIVTMLREHIYDKTGLSASAGVSCNRLLAKICSDINKPNGQFVLDSDTETILKFMQPLSVSKIPGIGKVTSRILAALGIETCEHLFDMRNIVVALFSKTAYEFLIRVSLGIGSTTVGMEWNRKSMSVERTFVSDLLGKLKSLSEKLAEDLETEQLCGKTITVKIKTDEFDVKTRAKSYPRLVFSAADIYDVAHELLQLELPLCCRLLGVRMSGLEPRSNMLFNSDITRFLKKKADLDQETVARFTCPVCSKLVEDAATSNSNSKLNQHIDLCLNKEAIQAQKKNLPLESSVIVLSDSDSEMVITSSTVSEKQSKSTAKMVKSASSSSHNPQSVATKSKEHEKVHKGSQMFMKQFLSSYRKG